TETIDFADPCAVKALNRALLITRCGVSWWDIPPGYLCPPVPGRAAYIDAIADLLAESGETIPKRSSVEILDIGTGANLIYPIIGHSQYGWHFTGSDIDDEALTSAENIIMHNPSMKDAVTLRRQTDSSKIFSGIIMKDEFFDAVICNPPFHASEKDAREGTRRKWKNLGKDSGRKPLLNFGGKPHELWCLGGEESFAAKMIEESRNFARQCRWFTILIAKEEHLCAVRRGVKNAGAGLRIIELKQGNKTSRIAAWTYAN
ncbi:MAG: 23S rRNA (adenine(1618)-N(6))-methyltransferase RlmF, partial [Spirochaetota bacterium]